MGSRSRSRNGRGIQRRSISAVVQRRLVRGAARGARCRETAAERIRNRGIGFRFRRHGQVRAGEHFDEGHAE